MNRRTKLATALAALVCALFGVVTAAVVSPQSSSAGQLPPLVDQQQAAQVVAAYEQNGKFSECMAAHGYYVPWEMTIHLAPAINDKALEAREAALEKMMQSDAGVVSTQAYEDVGLPCRYADPAADDDQLYDIMNGPDATSAINRADYWAQLMDRARALGWSPDKPFGALTSKPLTALRVRKAS
jgi:hypothetical protein